MEKFLKSINKNIYNNITKNIQGRKLVIWGFGKFGKSIQKGLLKNNMSVSMFVDNNAAKIESVSKEIKIELPNILAKNKKEFYVIVATNYYEEIEEFLISNNYNEITDYLYILHKPILVRKCENYIDAYGNKFEGRLNNLTVNFNGWNSNIKIEKNCTFGEKSEIITNMGSIIIGANCTFGEKTKILSNDYSSIIIKKNSSYGEKADIRSSNSNMIIGENCSFGDYLLIETNYNGEILIGDSCMVSRNVSIINNDGHPIFNILTEQQINMKESIFIGNHVWIGVKSSILSKSKIGDGSIIGANSLVKNTFPNNCIIVGIPAKITRKNIAWDRGITDSNLIKDRSYWNITEESFL